MLNYADCYLEKIELNEIGSFSTFTICIRLIINDVLNGV
ncbi:hypothetical protein M116_4441 [Bacteroides fragilis str. 3719 A10]|nr:hypothetical protein M117_4256 [Bacteroides fragilis str. 3774 T13]EXZ12095.1 hypothetical protein M071_4036 [Bacteroides fragilis str. Ds-233]EXZ56154.1 hypothetical protein M116_4441 [Bacteroides fragilis str. 3719 A10]